MNKLSPSSPQSQIEELLGQMTLLEKCTMLAGRGPWTVPGCPRLGIPDWAVSDGPAGVRGRRLGPGLLVPGPSALAATWDPDLVREIGIALGEECQDKHIDMLLAPAVNVHRSPRNGRHFESYSEDPTLSARMAVGYIQGVQSTDIGACIKHFVANDQETDRRTVDVRVDERALREIYLPAFEAAVKEAGVRGVMGAYNFVNGYHACAQPELLQGVLKGEWGFDGLVMSDWNATKSTCEPALYGLDLEMPGGGHWDGGQLQTAVERGEVDEALIDDKVRRLLVFLLWRGRLQAKTEEIEAPVERPEHRDLVRRAAAASMVLLRNEGSLLPLASGQTLAVIGPLAEETSLFGGGSAALRPYRQTNVLSALTERLGTQAVTFAPGLRLRKVVRALPAEWLNGTDATVEWFAGPLASGKPFSVEQQSSASIRTGINPQWPVGEGRLGLRMRLRVTPPQSGHYLLMAAGMGETRLFINGELAADSTIQTFSPAFGLWAGTGEWDFVGDQSYEFVVEHLSLRETQFVAVEIGCELVSKQREDLLQAAEQVATAADVAIVVVGTSHEWESEEYDRTSLTLPAEQDELVRRVRAANPRTVVVLNCGAPMLLPWFEEVPATLLAWYPGQEGGEAIADVLLGEVDPGGRMPTTWARREQDSPAYLNFPGEANTVHYGEGLYVGYRWYDTRGIQPLISFGHGSSYAIFRWGEPLVSGSGTDLLVEVPITNVSDRTGSEVVQLYISSTCSPVHRPTKELAGFAKVHLAPGEIGRARIRLHERAFARWDLATHTWKVDPGTCTLLLAASATDVRACLPVTLV